MGYTELSSHDFRAICVKCTQNDTTKIDWLICGGVYYHSDRFDNYLTATFEDIPINVGRPFPSHEKLLTAWNAFVEKTVTELIRSERGQKRGQDLNIEYLWFILTSKDAAAIAIGVQRCRLPRDGAG